MDVKHKPTFPHVVAVCFAFSFREVGEMVKPQPPWKKQTSIIEIIARYSIQKIRSLESA